VILEENTVSRIISGEITQLRRPGPAPWREGMTFPVGWKDHPAEARVKVVSVESQALRDAETRDAKREGYRTREELLEAWEGADPDELMWLVRFQLADPVRILPRNPDSMEANYVDHPSLGIPGEPEAVDEFTQERISEQAHAKDSVINAEVKLHREARSLSKQIREETLAAGRAGFDIAEHLEKIRAELREIRRKREAA
jgi:hypothetical protein